MARTEIRSLFHPLIAATPGYAALRTTKSSTTKNTNNTKTRLEHSAHFSKFCPAAKESLLAAREEPMLAVQWLRVLFLHFEIEPALLQSQLPPGLALETYEGKARVSLAAVTMRRFRPLRLFPFWLLLLLLIPVRSAFLDMP